MAFGLEQNLCIVVWGVLAVEVVVVGLRGGLLHLVLGAIIVVLTLGLGAIVGSLDSASVVRSQELVHRVVGGILVLGVGDHVAMLELVVPVIVVVVTIPWRARSSARFHLRARLDERVRSSQEPRRLIGGL